jgi:hypothetical protein
MRAGLLSCLALLFAACAPVVEADFPSIEVVRPDIRVPPSVSGSLQQVTFSFVLDSTSLGASTNPATQSLITEVNLLRLSLRAKSGVDDLSFIKTLHAVASVPASKSSSTIASRQVEVADYVRQDEQPVGAVFEVPIPEPVDLLPLLRLSTGEPRQIVVVVNLGGEMPTTSWTTDVAMVLSVHLRQ